MKRCSHALGLTSLILAACVTSATASEIAVSLDPNETTFWGWPDEYSNHGWQFTVNYSVELTHIGMLDVALPPDMTPDGFGDPHDVGLFLTDGTLLTWGTLSRGTGDMLVDNFRYVPVSHVRLVPGIDYVVVYHTGASTWDDANILDIPSFDMHPAVDYVIARWGYSTELDLPPNLVDPYGEAPYRFGTNFLFVPEPSTLVLAGLAGLVLRWR